MQKDKQVAAFQEKSPEDRGDHQEGAEDCEHIVNEEPEDAPSILIGPAGKNLKLGLEVKKYSYG